MTEFAWVIVNFEWVSVDLYMNFELMLAVFTYRCTDFEFYFISESVDIEVDFVLRVAKF